MTLAYADAPTQLNAKLHPVRAVKPHAPVAKLNAPAVKPPAPALKPPAPALRLPVPAVRTQTIVLQPIDSLNQTNSLDFQLALETALEQVMDGVVVDLLWVHAADDYGLAALVAGLQRAAARGKFLSFQSMNASIECALEDAWARQQELNAGGWTHTFSSDLESFLDGFAHK